MTSEVKEKLILARIAEVANNGDKELDLSNLGLDLIPKEVFELDKLETLKFMNNKLIEIPYEISNMKRLRALYLFNNKIKQIDKRLLVDLPYLDCFDLGGNPFDYYSAIDFFYKNNPWQGYARCLSKIDKAREESSERFMYFDKIHVFPKEVYELTNLTSLSIFGEAIKELPIGISNLCKLQYLDLSGNKLKSLPSDIAELKFLESIRLDSNEFEEFPNILLDIPSLARIYINDNKIKNFPLTVIHNKRFVTINGFNNPIENFSHTIFYHNLEEIRERL